ncbi:MAG: hypothetical protein AB4290_11445 [Spirulina sp.]
MNRNYFWFLIALAALYIAYYGRNWNTSVFISSTDTPSVDLHETRVSLQQIYEIIPNFKQCREGVIKESEKQKVLNRVNFIRNLHELPPVTYQSNDDRNTAKAALITAVNSDEDNEDIAENQKKCWSEEGEAAIQNSTGYFVFYPDSRSTFSWVNSEHFIDALFQDPRRKGLGRRELLLNPFLSAISFARADGFPDYSHTEILTYEEEEVETSVTRVTSVALHIVSKNKISQNLKREFIAYPYLNYPYELFQKDEYVRGYPPMSFSAIADPNNPENNDKVDFSIATIEIRDKRKQLIPVRSITIEESRIGLGKILFWYVDELKRDRLYHVKINNVKVNDRDLNYTYWFKLK